MSVARWRVGPPQMGQTFFASDGRGVGGGDPSHSSTTLIRGGSPEAFAADPFDSNDIKTICEEFRCVKDEYPRYSNVRLATLAQRLIKLATRTPWVDDPALSEPMFVKNWHQDVLGRVAFYFPRILESMDKSGDRSEIVLSVAGSLIERCGDIIDRNTLFFLFGGCIAALPQVEHMSPIAALLSTMMRHPDLSNVQKLPDRLEPIKGAIAGLSPKRFGEVFRSLDEVMQRMRPNDPQYDKARDFLLGVNRLYFAP